MQKLLKAEMGKRHMTQQEISLLLELAPSEISRYIQGQNPSVVRLEYITDKLGYEVLIVKKHTRELRDAKSKITEKDLRQILEEYPGLGEAEARIILGVVRSLQDEKKPKQKRVATGRE